MSNTTFTSILATMCTALCMAPAHAGYTAFAGANAGVRDLTDPSYPTLSPWPFYARDGHDIRGPSISSASLSNGGNYDDNLEVSAWASADLASGSLRALARTRAQQTDPNRIAIAYAEAEFGDSFTFQGAVGVPFIWTAGSQANFSLHVNGTLYNGSDSSISPDVFVSLMILQHGAVANPAFTGDMVLGWFSWQSYKAADGSIHSWSGTDGNVGMAVQATGSLTTGGVDLKAGFQPQGDFDWYMSLSATSEMLSGSGYQYSDFGHTLTASFTGPAGAQVVSSSGLFPVNATPVPEPATATLWLAGLALGTAAARRRSPRPVVQPPR